MSRGMGSTSGLRTNNNMRSGTGAGNVTSKGSGDAGAFDARRADSMFMTVSGDHSRTDYPEYVYYMCRPFLDAGDLVSVYEGLMLGGADKLFGLDELGTWLRRYRYAAFDMRVFLPAVHTCLEYAVNCRIQDERPGAPNMAKLAAYEILRDDPFKWRASARGWLSMWWLLKRFPSLAGPGTDEIMRRFKDFDKALDLYEELVRRSVECETAEELAKLGELLYKKVLTRYFAPRHDQDPMPEWYDLDKPGDEDEKTDAESRHADAEKRTGRKLVYGTGGEKKLLADLTDADIALIPEYIERNFGPSFKTGTEMERIESELCTGIHENRKLHFTDGIPREGAGGQSEAGSHGRRIPPPILESYAANEDLLAQNEAVAKAGIRGIETAFRNMLRILTDPEVYTADHGTLINSALWKAGRVSEPKLFYKETPHNEPSIAVDLLIDASGSQQKREAMVALQSYMFSAALSRVGIPHRVMSYCTYGDHTVIRRFRDYGDGPATDARILEYHAGSNNRDGLAIAAAGHDLLKRTEDRRIMVVLSDGLPNDMTAGRIKKGRPPKYVGDVAIKDTCFQLRMLQRHGIETLGIFLGDDEELGNERFIFGSSFLHIRRAEDFSGSAGRRLSEMLTRY